MKKQKRLMVCLVAGLLVLSVSAVAAFGSVNGYANYKNAVKALALEEENFSVSGTMVMTLDGKELMSMSADVKWAAPNHSTVLTAKTQESNETQYETLYNGVNTHWSTDGEYFYQYDNAGEVTVLFGIDEDDEMSQRLINFMEIGADTVMGDLKNNFVEVGSENGSKLYQVNISNAQVPALVNSGLSLFAYVVANDSQPSYTTMYEDYDQTYIYVYEKATGTTLSEEFKTTYIGGNYDASWATANEDILNAMGDAFIEQDNKYYEILDQKGGGIIYVKADGSYDYYTDYRAYLKANPGKGDFGDDMYYYVGQDMILNDINCTFGIDKAGHLTTNHYVVSFTTTDADGGKHDLVITVDGTFSDYGTTVVTEPDLTGLKDAEAQYEPQAQEAEVTTEEVTVNEEAAVIVQMDNNGEVLEATSFPDYSESSSF